MPSWQSAPAIGQQPAAPAQPFGGDPIVAPPPPSERRAERDQQLQEVRTAQQMQAEQERLRLAQEASSRAQGAEQRAQVSAQRGTVEQGKAASFLKRAINAETNFRGLGDVQPRGLIGQSVKENFPNVANMISGGSRQQADQAEREFIAAILRYDSGAAIPPEEFVTNGQIYFPRPGDEPETLKQKAQARKVAIEGLLAASGPQGERVPLPDFLSGVEPDAQDDESLPLRGTVTDESPRTPSGGGGGSPLLTGLAQGTGDIVQGVGDTVGIVTDPFARVLADTLGYDGSQTPSLGTRLREGVGLPQSPEGVVRSVNQFASGSLVGGLAARSAAPLAEAGGVLQNALSTLGRTPIRDTVAGAGAGAGSAIGEQIGGTPGQIAGIVAGGLSANSAANRLANVASGSVPNALAQAASRQRVDLLPADAGGPVARAITTGTKASPLSVGPVVAAAERQQKQFGSAVQRAAASQGEVIDTQSAGEAVQAGAKQFSKETAERGSRLYDRAANLARGVRAIKPTNTIVAVDEAIARMKANPAASPSDISSLEAFKSRIESGVSIQGLRDARTTLSQGVYDGKLRSSADQAMWKGILGNVADDIDAGLRSVGKGDAADTFRAADKFWQQRVATIDQTLTPIIGKDGQKGGEQVLQAIESMARGNSGGNLRLSRLMAALPEAEAGNVRATLIDRLGRAKPGSQDAQGEAFSAPTFLTNWNKMTPQAKASMFPDKAARDNLNDLALLAEGTKRGQSMANTSNTGVAIGANVAVGGSALYANPIATLVGAGSVYLTGKLMADPRFAKILARTSKMPPAQANRTFTEQLGVLATRQPGLAGDIEALTRAVNDNTAGALAAEEQQP